MNLKSKYTRHFVKLIEETMEGREQVVNDIANLLEQNAFEAVRENFLIAVDIEKYLLAREIEYLNDICKPAEDQPQAKLH